MSQNWSRQKNIRAGTSILALGKVWLKETLQIKYWKDTVNERGNKERKGFSNDLSLLENYEESLIILTQTVTLEEDWGKK